LPKKQAYVDTNVVLDFYWDEHYSRKTGRKDLVYRLFENAALGVFEAYISYYSIIEVTLHFNDWYLLQKCIKDGYSFNQFKSHKKEFKLSEEEKHEIEDILEFFRNWEGVNLIEIEKIEGQFFKDELPKYLLHSVELMDALHVNSAVEIECSHFITKDGELRQRIENMKRDNFIPSRLRPVSPKGFMNEFS